MRLSETIVDGVVFDKGASTSPLKKKNHGKKDRRRFAYAYALIGVVLLVVISILVTLENNNHKGDTVAPTYSVCSSKQNQHLLNEAATAIKESDVAQLGVVVDKIQSLPNNQADPNCDFVNLVYSIDSDNSVGASMYLAKLEQAYNSKQGYNKYLVPVSETLAELKQQTAYLKTLNNSTEQRIKALEIPKR